MMQLHGQTYLLSSKFQVSKLICAIHWNEAISGSMQGRKLLALKIWLKSHLPWFYSNDGGMLVVEKTIMEESWHRVQTVHL